jgi:hypothetical protein
LDRVSALKLSEPRTRLQAKSASCLHVETTRSLGLVQPKPQRRTVWTLFDDGNAKGRCADGEIDSRLDLNHLASLRLRAHERRQAGDNAANTRRPDDDRRQASPAQEGMVEDGGEATNPVCRKRRDDDEVQMPDGVPTSQLTHRPVASINERAMSPDLQQESGVPAPGV